MRLGVGLILIYLVGILATETILQILRILRILQLKLRVQLVGSRAAGTWIYRGLIPALLKQLNQFNKFYSTAQRHFQQVSLASVILYLCKSTLSSLVSTQLLLASLLSPPFSLRKKLSLIRLPVR